MWGILGLDGPIGDHRRSMSMKVWTMEGSKPETNDRRAIFRFLNFNAEQVSPPLGQVVLRTQTKVSDFQDFIGPGGY